MAQILLVAGEPGHRYATANAEVMMHQGSAGIGGPAADIAIQADRLLRTSSVMHQIIADNTGKSTEQVAVDGDRDHWLSAEDALAYGMIDRIVSDIAQIEGWSR